MSIFQSKAAKKKALLKKNKYHQMIYEFVRLRREEAGRVEEMERPVAKPRIEDRHDEQEQVWSAKMQQYRSKITDQKRTSQERWNRFSGTSDAGSRGL
jgi:hypothetical protein